MTALAMPPPFGAIFAKVFLQHGADPNLQACDGFTPVHVATMWSREETLSLLLQHGGNIRQFCRGVARIDVRYEIKIPVVKNE